VAMSEPRENYPRLESDSVIQRNAADSEPAHESGRQRNQNAAGQNSNGNRDMSNLPRSSDGVNWRAFEQDILARLNLRAEYEAMGVSVVGYRPSEAGWLSCRAAGREDRNPSAAINVKSGRYRDFGGEGKSCSLWEFTSQFAPQRGATWLEARRFYADRAGVRLPRSASSRRADLGPVGKVVRPQIPLPNDQAVRDLIAADALVGECCENPFHQHLANLDDRHKQKATGLRCKCCPACRRWAVRKEKERLQDIIQEEKKEKRPISLVTIHEDRFCVLLKRIRRANKAYQKAKGFWPDKSGERNVWRNSDGERIDRAEAFLYSYERVRTTFSFEVFTNFPAARIAGIDSASVEPVLGRETIDEAFGRIAYVKGKSSFIAGGAWKKEDQVPEWRFIQPLGNNHRGLIDCCKRYRVTVREKGTGGNLLRNLELNLPKTWDDEQIEAFNIELHLASVGAGLASVGAGVFLSLEDVEEKERKKTVAPPHQPASLFAEHHYYAPTG